MIRLQRWESGPYLGPVNTYVIDAPRTSSPGSRASNVADYSADEVNPPEGARSEDWIRSGFTR